MTELSDDKLLSEIHTLFDDLGRPPTRYDMRQSGSYHPRDYEERFGSWNRACRLAGFNPTSGSKRPQISDEKLLSEITRLKKRFGRPPKRKEMNEYGKYSSTTYRVRFGKWSDAIEAAGYEPNRRDEPTPKEELLGDLKRVHLGLGRPPSQSDIFKHSKYSPSLYRKRFGGVPEAVEAAGFDVDDRKKMRSDGWVPKHVLIEDVQRVAEELGHPPRVEHYKERGNHAERTCYRKFGDWEGFLEAADFDPDDLPPIESTQQINEEDLLEEIRRLTDDLGKVPTTTEMNEYGEYSTPTYYDRFNSWSSALKKALDN